jgi:hypothetical protein
MTYEFKCKIIDQWFSKHQTEWNVFGVKYNAALINWFGSTWRILIYWQDAYQMLTITDMFTGALTRTFYKDTRQIDELIHLITENKFRKK